MTKIVPGSLVTSDYRVPPFLDGEVLRVVELRGNRARCEAIHRAGVAGWLDIGSLATTQLGLTPPAAGINSDGAK